ncbi:hypothetical protein RI054_17g80770 [Pseudoscourfieldia marina]
MGFGKSEGVRSKSSTLAILEQRKRRDVCGNANVAEHQEGGGGSCRSRHLAKGAVVSHHPRGSSVAATAPESESAPPYENPNLTESNPVSESAKTESDTSTASAR